MNRPSPGQYQRLRVLIAEHEALEQRLKHLKTVVPATKAVVEAEERRRADLTNFVLEPHRLAEAQDLYRKASAPQRRTIVARYRYFLERLAQPQGSMIDFVDLPPAARPFLLAAFLQLRVANTFPALDLERSRPPQRLVYVSTAGPLDPAAWRSAMPLANDWLGRAFEITASTATTLTLEARAPWTDALPFDKRCLKAGALVLGFDTITRQPAAIPFADLSSGTLVAGVAGSGKTNAVQVLIRSLLANLALFERVYLIDGKDGVAFHRYQNLHPKVSVVSDEAEVWAIVAGLKAAMAERNRLQREAGRDNARPGEYVAIVIDEMSTFTAKPSSDSKSPANKAHATFIDNLAALARRGRSVGYRFIVSVQEPNEAQIPVGVRNNCQTILSFKLNIDAHATALFGALDEADPRKLKRGFAILRDGLAGTTRTVKFPVIMAPGGGS